jgi:hypothetical protein
MWPSGKARFVQEKQTEGNHKKAPAFWIMINKIGKVGRCSYLDEKRNLSRKLGNVILKSCKSN